MEGTSRKANEFTLSDEAIDEHVTFLQNSDPAIVGETCQMLSALGIVMYPKEGLAYLIRLIDTMIKDGFFKETSEGDLIVDSVDKILPKVFRDKKCVKDQVNSPLPGPR